MLELDFWFFLVAAPAVVFAGISKGGFGSGASFASASILALVIDPWLALGVMLPLLMLIDLASLRPYWGKWNWASSRLLILGGVPGAFLGAAVFSIINDDVLRVMIGAISLFFVIWQVSLAQLVLKRSARRQPNWVGYLVGVVSGFTGFVSHAGGPVAAIYLLSQRISKTEYQATTVLVFFVINIIKTVSYGYLGLFTPATLQAGLILAPLAILGTWFGVRLHLIITERWFFFLTYALLTTTGLKLTWDGLT